MRLYQILNEDASKPWTITFTDQWTQEEEGEGLPDIERWEFDIRYNGKVVGAVEYDNYFNHIQADFGARTVELSNYVEQYVDDPAEVIIQAIGNYFNSLKGQKHFAVMSRQQGLSEEKERCVTCDGTGKQLVGDDLLVFDCPDCKDEELEERKVTKTMAGKQQRPIDKLAVDTKKKKPNQGKQPVELDKFKDTKDLANEILKGEYNQ